MDPEIKRLWVDTLLSDEYEANNDGCLCIKLDMVDEPWKYDPLGVLCELARQAGVALQVEEMESTRELACVEQHYNGQDAQLPRKVMEWSGLQSSDPILFWPRQSYMEQLSAIHFYNETGTFKEIAGLIDEQL